MQEDNTKQIIVVGAGVSGLSLAINLGRLHKSNSRGKLCITIIEANKSVGGRVRTINTDVNDDFPRSTLLSLAPSRQEYWKERYAKFYPWSTPLGAEFVHGIENNPSVVDRILRNQSKERQQESEPKYINTNESSASEKWEMDLTVDYSNKRPNLTIFVDDQCFNWFDGSAVHAEDTNSSWPHRIHKARELWSDLLVLKEDDRDMSLGEYVEYKYADATNLDENEQQQVLSLLDAVYAATAATTSDLLGIKETSRQENAWPYGEENVRLGYCYSEFIDQLLLELDLINDGTSVSIDVVTNSPVQEISSSSDSNGFRVICHNQQSLECDCIGVTIPLAAIKNGSLQFTGSCKLKDQQKEAIKAINVLGGGKVHALIQWDVDIKKPQTIDYSFLQGIFVCPLEEFKQIWFRWNATSILVTGFCVFGGQSKHEIDCTHLESSLKDLTIRILSKCIHGDIFLKNCDGNPCLTFSAFDLYDWSEDEFVQGMYSSPSVSSDRTGAMAHYEVLAERIGNCVYFAGEHTHRETSATVQSALETGIRAAHEIYLAHSHR